MNQTELERVFRQSSAQVIGSLAGRFRDLDLAEEAFAEACARACENWADGGPPTNPAAWLYRVANRVMLDVLRRQQTRYRLTPVAEMALQPSIEDELLNDNAVIPDDRLRLIFICCHPAVAPDSRALLTLRLVCGLTVPNIAQAFLLSESAVAQRLVRAKHKIAAAGVPFELPERAHWEERLESVLVTMEIAYGKAHEDAAGTGVYAFYSTEMLRLTELLVELVPHSAEVQALAAIIHFAEARRPARLNSQGSMIPVSAQDPALWRRELIVRAEGFLLQARAFADNSPRVLQARLQAAWCRRRHLGDPEPWPEILDLYDELLLIRDDIVVRINRAVALAEVAGADTALKELDGLDAPRLSEFVPFLAVRASLLARTGDLPAACAEYDRLLALELPSAERKWLEKQRNACRR